MTRTHDSARAVAIGGALSTLPNLVLDPHEGSTMARSVLERLSQPASSLNVLTGLGLALSNYQLGTGGSPQYWCEVDQLINTDCPINNATDISKLMSQLMDQPVASRFARVKLERVNRLLLSDIPEWMNQRTIEEMGRDCMDLWNRLAGAMRQGTDRKTIVYAMRIFDRMHRIATGRYVDFPMAVPIVVDLRIGRVALASGLMGVADAADVLRLMVEGNRYVARNRRSILAAWQAVGESTGGLSLFRIDGIVWELGEVIHQNRQRRAVARSAAAVLLKERGADEAVAEWVAQELTHALPPARSV